MVEFRYRSDEVTEQPSVTLDAFLDQSNATAVRLEPDDDARALIPFLDRLTLIEVAFPKYRDGRGYSAARIQREAVYQGELRAIGDVLHDQLFYLKRCGFDSFAIREDKNAEIFEELMPTNDLWKDGILRSKERCTTVKTRVMANNQQLLRVDREDTHQLSETEEKNFINKIKSYYNI